MHSSQVQFSVLSHAAWAPGLDTPAAWQDWAAAPSEIAGSQEPGVKEMPPMLRRRAGFLGKMALEVAYKCLDGRQNIPTIFCSRHGDVARALALLNNVVDGEPMSPTNFGLAVHNANAGLFSIARSDQASHIALAAGSSTVEHGVIEACSLLADGAQMVLLVVYDTQLPAVYAPYLDCNEQPHAWSWLIVPAAQNRLQLSWTGVGAADAAAGDPIDAGQMPASLGVWKFFVGQEPEFRHTAQQRSWHWSRHA